MATLLPPLRPSLLPRQGCIFLPSLPSSRGKKKLARPSTTLPVRLLKDVPSFGRKGAIVPIPRGQMRNVWFPASIATYLPHSELRALRRRNIPVERDVSFMPTSSSYSSPTVNRDAEEIPSSAALREASMFHESTPSPGGLSPARSTELLELFLPSELAFYRQPLSDEGEGGQTIYNPVSTVEVQHAVRNALAGHPEARRVEVGGLEMGFVGGEREVKRVGEFGVEIRVPGAEGSVVRRVVKVVAQEGGA
ncbi:hypothetical protein M433DRAFT_147243 [Acidomyces richmondensis BFW]|nr:hypothetical protein M433DRAFT_147243 [Acidomyces richmondensis BFW]